MKIFRKACLLYVFLLFAAAGCAPWRVELSPVPTLPLKLDASGESFYIEVNDKRNPALKPVVGHVKNSYGMKLVDVVSDKDVTVWVKESIVTQLTGLGATAVEASTNSSVNRINVDITVCYAQAYWNYGGEVSVVLTVTRDGKDVISEKTYTGKAKLGKNRSAMENAESYGKVLELAMEDMLQKMIPGIVKDLKG